MKRALDAEEKVEAVTVKLTEVEHEVQICNEMLDRDNVQMAQNDIDLKAPDQ